MLIKIGDFARSTGVTIKALRHYEKLGLIEPVWVNRFNGYRYYAPEQLETMDKLLAYKSLGFPLKEIAKLLDPELSNQALKNMLNSRVQILESQIQCNGARVAKLKACLAKLESGSSCSDVKDLIAIQQPEDRQKQKEFRMEVQIKELPAFSIVGVRYQGKNKNNEIADVWTMFNKRQHEIKNVTDEGAYGICSIPNGLAEGEFEYICALPVSKPGDIPKDMIARSYPAMRVAVFEQQGSYENLRKTYADIYQKWLPDAGLQPLKNGFDIEVYDEKFNDFAADSIMYIYVPIAAE